jgi:hypothetical protein
MPNPHPLRLTAILTTMVWLGLPMVCLSGVNYEEAPINYSKTVASNAITRLQTQIDDATCSLTFEKSHGYLKSLLEVLEIPASSQVLTFAKTSMQAGYISPATPRALYFNDQIHLGYVQDGLIEVAVADPGLGMAFYTLEQVATDKPRFKQASNNCLTCHGAARTRNVPGLQVRSVYPDPKGQPVIAAGSVRTDHSTPFEKRWGGWYVTGRHGTQQHLGNFTLADDKKPKLIDNSAGQNITDLSTRFDTTKYLTPHSDIVALMVLEHQADTYNLITIANFEARYAEFMRAKELEEPNSVPVEIQRNARARIAKAGDALVRGLLFCGEAPLKERIEGTGGFSSEFSSKSPRDAKGRSLRDFDLEARMFKHPCSYLIYSDAFDALPQEMKKYICERIRAVLTTSDLQPEFAHLSANDRAAILAILQETKDDVASAIKEAAISKVNP